MTSLSLPSGDAARAAAGANPNELAGHRNTAGGRGGGDGTAFGALLGAFDETAAPNAAVGATRGGLPLAARAAEASTFAVSSSSLLAPAGARAGVLVGLEKQRSASTKDATPDAPETKTADEAAPASADNALAWLLLGVSAAAMALSPGAAGARAPATSAGSGSPALASIPGAGAAHRATDGAPSLPSEDEAPAAIALVAGAPPAEVTVLRSITYLGLDPAGGASGAKRMGSNASSGSGLSPATTNAVRAEQSDSAQGSVLSTGGGSAATGGEASMQNAPNQGGGRSSSDTAVSAQVGSAAAASAALAGGAPILQINQLAGFIADAAGADDSLATDASALGGSGAVATHLAPVKELDVQLNPKSLGALSIQMRLSNGTLNVTIAAGNPDTLKLVADQSGAISDRLKSLDLSANVTVKAMDVSAPTAASGQAAQSGTKGHGEAQQDQSGQTAGGSPGGGQSFQGGGAQRHPARPQGGHQDEPGGNPGHRFV